MPNAVALQNVVDQTQALHTLKSKGVKFRAADFARILPTGLLCAPGINGPPGEHRLALGEEDYEVRRIDDLWKVVVRSTGELIYAGPGPVQIRRSPAPF